MSMLECPACGQQFDLTDTHILPTHDAPDTQQQCQYSGRLGILVEIVS
jgi:hypothetical protein